MIEQVLARIDRQKEQHTEAFFELLRIPSISTDPESRADIRKGAQWVERFFREGGFEVELVDTPGHPCVLSDSGPATGDGPTVLVYGHYDVQPVGDESLWHTPAFEPTVRDGLVYARGSADDKGQVLTHLLAAKCFKTVAGRLPIRVKFVIEGEEEIGSVNLKAVIEKHRERLACDYVVLSDTPKYNHDTPAITYGTKGMIYKELTLTGPKQDLHSGSYGGTVTNPGNALASIVASLHDADRRVTISGYYDDVRELTDVENARIADLPFEDAAYAEAVGVDALTGENGFTTLQRKWARPTLDVNGMIGGFTGKGAMTVIPSKVSSKMSMRIVPDQDPETISKAFDDAVRAACPPGIRLEIQTHAMCGPYISDLDSVGMKAAAEAMTLGFRAPPVYMREGGSLPILPLFKEVLGADSLMLGFCEPDCNAHSPNEFFGLDDFHRGIRTAATFLHLLSGSK